MYNNNCMNEDRTRGKKKKNYSDREIPRDRGRLGEEWINRTKRDGAKGKK